MFHEAATAHRFVDRRPISSRVVRLIALASTLVAATVALGAPAAPLSAASPVDTNLRNFALGAPSTQSSTAYEGVPSRATDSDVNGAFGASTVTSTGYEKSPWWQVDLGRSRDVELVRIWNRTDCCSDRLGDFWVFLSAVPFTSNDPAALANDRGVTAVHVTQTPNPSVDLRVTSLARYVRVQLSGTSILSLAEVQVMGQAWTSNYATDAVVSQSSSRYGGAAEQAIDANADGDFGHHSVTHTKTQLNPWWQADLGHSRTISEVRVWNRTDCCAERLSDFWVQVSDSPFTSNDPAVVATQGNVKSVRITSAPSPMVVVPIKAAGRYVRIQRVGTEALSLAEVEINGPQLRNYVPGGVATQSSTDFGAIAENAQDGNTDGNFYHGSLTHTAGQNNPWWQVKLGTAQKLSRVKIWNRTDCCTDRLREFWLFLNATPFTSNDPNVTAKQPGVVAYHFTNVTMNAASPALIVDVADVPTQYIRVQVPGGGVLSLAEVEAFGTETLAPVDALAWNATHKFGMFLHYGMGTATNEQWATPNSPPEWFNPPKTVDPTQWATAMKSAGMTWGVLTVKHHDGFALWPSAYSRYSIAGSPYQNGKGDIVRDYAKALRAQNLDVGIYFSIWDRSNGETPALVKNQLRELLTRYGPITYIFTDAWERGLTGVNKISYNEVRDFVRNISPATVIANNDHTNSLASTDFLVTEYYDYQGWAPQKDGLPKEVATMMDTRYSWFWNDGRTTVPRTAKWIVDTRNAAFAADAHFLLNIGPNVDGSIDPRYLAELQKVGQLP